MSSINLQTLLGIVVGAAAVSAVVYANYGVSTLRDDMRRMQVSADTARVEAAAATSCAEKSSAMYKSILDSAATNVDETAASSKKKAAR